MEGYGSRGIHEFSLISRLYRNLMIKRREAMRSSIVVSGFFRNGRRRRNRRISTRMFRSKGGGEGRLTLTHVEEVRMGVGVVVSSVRVGIWNKFLGYLQVSGTEFFKHLGSDFCKCRWIVSVL